MKKLFITLSLIFAFSFSFAQTKKETIDTIHVSGSYYSIEQKKMIYYQVVIDKQQIRNLSECYGYPFTDPDGKLIAYTPCGDYSLAKLVVLDTEKFIEFLKVNKLSFR